VALTEIRLPDEAALAAIDVPADVAALFDDADERIADYFERTQDAPVIAFVPCDFPAAWRALRWMQGEGLATGPSFCEWGSGFGVVAMLAATAGFESTGIEVVADLVEESERLATDHGITVEFVEGSFVPDGSDAVSDALTEFAWLDVSTPAAYDALGLDPEDFDVIFAYPWPGEQDVIFDLFDAHAADGALLLTQQGTEGTRLHRRAGHRRNDCIVRGGARRSR
jgi:hypothetical protein